MEFGKREGIGAQVLVHGDSAALIDVRDSGIFRLEHEQWRIYRRALLDTAA